MIGKLFYAFTCCSLLTTNAFPQNIELSDELEKSIDTTLQVKLLTALDSLVEQISRNDVSDNLVWKKEAKFSKAIFEEVYYYEKSYKDTSNTISISLLNCYPIGEGQYLNQLAYFKQSDDTPKSLQMLLSVVAHIEHEDIAFSTPLSYYTKTWKKQKVGSIAYYYRDRFRLDRAEKFAQKNVLFASRFERSPQEFRFFMVENYQEILRLLGFDYNIKSIGKLRDGFGVIGSDVIFSVMNNEDFSHDLFHYYSETIYDRSVRNWVTEEGIAYSWGNAYYTRKDGEMAEQKELLDILKQYIAQNKDINLLSLFENNFWTDKNGIYNHLAPDFKVGRLISSLICDEVQKRHGMDGIHQLIACGSKPNHFDPFFETTDRLIGINRKNFNEKVSRLIKKYE